MDVASVLRTIADEDLPVGTVVIDICAGGMTLFPVEDSLFITRPGHEDGAALAQWIDQAHAQGLRVFAGASLLRWWTPMSADPDPVGARPDLQDVWESGRQGGCTSVHDGRFASPWHARVQSSLVALARELGRRYPNLDGLYLDASLSSTSFTGFSEPARLAYIQAAAIDPVDLIELPRPDRDDHSTDRANAWLEWRLSEGSSLLRAVIAAFRESARAAGAEGPKDTTYETTGAFSTLQRLVKAWCLEDWLPLVLDQQVDALAFRLALHHQDPVGEHRAVLDVVGRSRTGTPAFTVLSGCLRGAPASLRDTYEPVAAKGLLRAGCVLDPYTDDQLAEALQLLRSFRVTPGGPVAP